MSVADGPYGGSNVGGSDAGARASPSAAAAAVAAASSSSATAAGSDLPVFSVGSGRDGERPVVLITGCSQGGIGHSLALALARPPHSHRVFGTVRHPSRLNDFSGCYVPPPGSVELLPMDVTDGESVRRAVGAVVKRTGGRLDVLVNNAGVGWSGAAAECGRDEAGWVFGVNVVGLMGVTREVIPHMVASGRGGKIVNMGSVTSYIALPWSSVYVASKSAVRAITSALRMELMPFGIQVAFVAAGSVRTNIVKPSPLYAHLPIGPPTPPPPSSTHQHRATGTDPDAFAAAVAADVAKASMPPTIVAGRWAWVVLVLLMFPEWVIEWIVAWRYGLSLVKVVVPTKQAAASAAAAVSLSEGVQGAGGRGGSGGEGEVAVAAEEEGEGREGIGMAGYGRVRVKQA
ncbi:hypothetical protein DFJ73DRAFT_793116 [Zopfochytrium polystomum]|nr:hypothetical protein DFJ73DRAFT_793116 [Zopfochytrium polystomum]